VIVTQQGRVIIWLVLLQLERARNRGYACGDACGQLTQRRGLRVRRRYRLLLPYECAINHVTYRTRHRLR
jgi:hypothetical protein